MPDPVSVADSGRRIRDVLPALVRQAPVGVGVVRHDRSIAYRNQELTRLLRLGPGLLADRTPWRLPPICHADGESFAIGAEPLDSLLRSGTPAAGQSVTVGRRDGTIAQASVTMTPIVDPAGTVIGAIMYALDVGAAHEAASLHTAFAEVIAHELRTPITSIYGGTQLLLDERLPADIRATVTADIAAEAERLHRLVEDLVAITQIEPSANQAFTEPVLLQRLAESAAHAEERRWPGRRVEVHAPVDVPAVRADDGYTTQVLRNLIANAIKYSPPSEPVVVRITTDEDGVAASVLDRGPGFPAGTGADAFHLFYRSPAVAAHLTGTGMGLYVARSLIEAQGGRIWLRDRVGGGAEVGFWLPAFDIGGTAE